MRVKLTVAYDGTNYVGWQSQVNGIAIQDVLNRAVSDLFGTEIKTNGASRTDTGVHSEGNVAVFDVETRIEVSKIAFALNARLPEDIRIVESVRVPDDFHPRFRKTIKTYEYHILNRKFPDPLLRLYAMHYYYPLDAEKMDTAAKYLVGEHDFASFCASGFSGKTTVREIYSASVTRKDDLIVFSVTGSGFLYNMVRIITGTLILVGVGQIPPEKMQEIIGAHDRGAAGPTAIAKGLVLKKIEYPENENCMKGKI